MYKIYDGLRVLEIADVRGSFCGKMLASFGAEVIKVEKPGGDESRMQGPFAGDRPGAERSISFAYQNTGKKSVELDLTSPAGRTVFLELAKTADVLIETLAPGKLDEWHIGYGELSAANPKIIMLSVTPFGQTGPRAQWRASTDLITDAFAGCMAEVGYKGKGPLHLGYDIQSMAASCYGLVAIQAAYHNRLYTGRGTHIDLAQEEAVAVWRSQLLGYVQVSGKNQPLYGGEGYVRQGLVNCKDGYAYVMIGGKWKELLTWFSDKGLDITVFDDPVYEPHTYEILTKWDSVLLERFNQLGAMYTKTEFMEEGQRRRIPCCSLESPDTLLDNKQLLSRGYFEEIDHPVLGKRHYPAYQAKMTAIPLEADGAAPLLGADTEAVLSELGYSAKEIADMREGGVI